MSGNARRSHSDRKRATRILTWSCLALIPVLAILTLGSAVLPTLTGDTLYPGRLYVRDGDAFTRSVQRLVAISPSLHPTTSSTSACRMRSLANRE